MQVLLLGQDPIPSTLDEVDDQEMQRKAVNSTGRHSSAEERVDSGGVMAERAELQSHSSEV